MFGRPHRSAPPLEDPSVARVEALLTACAVRGPSMAVSPKARPQAVRALQICACVTPDGAPTWLIYDTVDGALTWCRVEDGVALSDLVDGRQTAGGHADPSEVLRWVQGAAADPWGSGGHGSGDESVVQELGRLIRRL